MLQISGEEKDTLMSMLNPRLSDERVLREGTIDRDHVVYVYYGGVKYVVSIDSLGTTLAEFCASNVPDHNLRRTLSIGALLMVLFSRLPRRLCLLGARFFDSRVPCQPPQEETFCQHARVYYFGRHVVPVLSVVPCLPE